MPTPEEIIKEHFYDSKKEYEHDNLRVCEYGLQIESCRQCLFDALCNLKKNNSEVSSREEE